MTDELQIALEILSEADSRIRKDRTGIDARLQALFDLLIQVSIDISDDVGIGGISASFPAFLSCASE